MDYKEFKEIMNKHIFKDERKNLLEKIGENPERFVGIYRVTSPIPKIKQFLSQSREIKFGNGMEEVVQKILSEMGFINEDNKRITSEDGELLDIDQYFKDKNGNYYFVEQKIRDDHDSTKKQGQIENFKKKYRTLMESHEKIIGIMYFIDPCLTKNKKFYDGEIEKFYQEPKNKYSYGTFDDAIERIPRDTVFLKYGEEFFSYFGRKELFYNLEYNLKKWRSEINTEIEINFDNDSDSIFKEIKKLNTWKKLIMNDALWESRIIQAIFPNGETLRKVYSCLDKELKLKAESKSKAELKSKLENRLHTYYK